MSGTSVDSIDSVAICVELNESKTNIHLIKGIVYPIPDCIRKEIFKLFDDAAESLHRLSLLHMRLGSLFAGAALKLLEEAGLPPEEVAVIGSHGQTVHHVSRVEECCGEKLRGSLQIGEASVIAQKTGIPVVSDFRPADIAAGGTGAPLAPFLDYILFKNRGKDVAVQNIGGIGNVTWISKGADKLIAFDTGPGNMIIDMLVERYTSERFRFDKDGKIGRSGVASTELLERWMMHPFFYQNPPKSAGREEFGTIFWQDNLKELELSPDLIRTAEEFTARSIAQAYRSFLPRLPEMVVVTGGGVHNPIIMEALVSALKGSRVISGNKVGIDVDFKEAIAFALLGLFRFLGLPNNVPEATGAYREVVMGKLTLP